jgi:arginine repressor
MKVVPYQVQSKDKQKKEEQNNSINFIKGKIKAFHVYIKTSGGTAQMGKYLRSECEALGSILHTTKTDLSK